MFFLVESFPRRLLFKYGIRTRRLGNSRTIRRQPRKDDGEARATHTLELAHASRHRHITPILVNGFIFKIIFANNWQILISIVLS